MGHYINPQYMSKEEWLAQNGYPVSKMTHLTDAEFGTWRSPGGYPMLPVCLVDNGPFKAAAVAYSENELQVFLRPDPRPKQWYLVRVKDLLKVGALPEWPMEGDV